MSKQGLYGGEGGRVGEGARGAKGKGRVGSGSSAQTAVLEVHCARKLVLIQKAQAEILVHMGAGLGIPTIPVVMGLTWKKTMSSCQFLGSQGHMGPRQAEEQ